MDKPACIWVVEDDTSLQRLVVDRLRSNGFEALAFGSAEQAHAALKTQPLPSLIILDMLLPGMSGVDLVRLLKKEQTWEHIPIIVVSVLSAKEGLGAEAEGQAAFWINKPFDAGHLIQTVQKVLLSVGPEGAAQHG